jgi:hypothetical protein
MRRRFKCRALAPALIAAGALVAVAAATAANWTMGNAAVDRPSLDTFRNFAVVDQTNPADAEGLLDHITYYARLASSSTFVQNGVAFAVVRRTAPCPGATCTFKVVWISGNIPNPAASGVQTFVPTTPVPVKAGDTLALYFPGNGLVPYTLLAQEDPALWEFWESNNSGKPVVGEQLTISDPLGTSAQHRRQYSVEGWTTDCTFSIGRPINANGSSVFKAGRGVLPLKLIPSCGNGSLAPAITIDYTGSGNAAINEEVASVSSADTGTTMRWDARAGQYIYNLKTKRKSAGHYTLSIKVAGIEVLAVAFDMK